MAAILFLSGGNRCKSPVRKNQTAPPPAPTITALRTCVHTRPLPPDIDPTSPLAQVIKLMQAGVSEVVIMAYVSNSYERCSVSIRTKSFI